MLTANTILRFLHTFLRGTPLFPRVWLICWLAVEPANAVEISIFDSAPAKKTDQNSIKVYTKNVPGSDFVLFRGTAVFNSTIDSVLAVVFDSSSYVDWLYQCKESALIEKLNFNERYQYQVIHVPFPYNDRDTIVYSKMQQDRETGEVIISFLSSSDYCSDKDTPICKKIKSSRYERINKIAGSYYLKKVDQGIEMTWIQHTEPGGELPGWLVNLYVVDTPFQSFLNLAEKLQEDKYKQARLVYDDTGRITAINIPEAEPSKRPDDFTVIPTF